MEQIIWIAAEFGVAVIFWGIFAGLSLLLLQGIVVPNVQRSARKGVVPVLKGGHSRRIR